MCVWRLLGANNWIFSRGCDCLSCIFCIASFFTFLFAVVLHVAVLAQTKGVHLLVGAAFSWLVSPALVVAVFTHALGIEFAIKMIAGRYQSSFTRSR